MASEIELLWRLYPQLTRTNDSTRSRARWKTTFPVCALRQAVIPEGMNDEKHDHWESYESRRPRPIVPEPSTYGALLVLACFVLLAIRRYNASKGTK